MKGVSQGALVTVLTSTYDIITGDETLRDAKLQNETYLLPYKEMWEMC